MQSISIQGGMVGSRVFLLREGWRTNYSCAGRGERLMYW